MNLPEKLRDLRLWVAGAEQASLIKRSVYSLSYTDAAQHKVGLSLPIADRVFQDGDLFASLDMNLPEGYLFERIVDRYPKFPLNKMHLLALMGAGAIGRVSYGQVGQPAAAPLSAVSRQELLSGDRSQALFAELVDAFLGVGSALSGVQPKVMVPVSDKAILSAPNVIIKTEGARYPGLSANEWMCLTAARCAGLAVPPFALSADGQLLVVDRFDILPDGTRLGFEDMAAIMQLRVRDRLSSRKYIGSYEDIALALRLVCSNVAAALEQFYGYLVLSVLLRNGDAHLKNFAVLYDETRAWLSPLYDQVTTTIYPYERPGGVESIDRTMALKLRRGGRSGEASRARSYPNLGELLAFGRDVCGVYNPAAVVAQVQDGMRAALRLAQAEPAVPSGLRALVERAWIDGGLAY
jgi:serine/threonine-protein kinase HipA